jgi:glycosyltransferase involved in cell wall biosynthesis
VIRNRATKILTYAADGHIDAPRETPSGRGVLGVNLAGYFSGGFGVAESARFFAKTLEKAQIPYVLNNIVPRGQTRAEPTLPNFSRRNPYPINLVHVNADESPSFYRSRGLNYSRLKKNVGIWFWELSRSPERFFSSFKYYDEIWTCSSFVHKAISEVSPIPTIKLTFPLFVDDNHAIRRRDLFDLREESFVFLLAFDMLSVFQRKNPLALIKAFKNAFSEQEDVVLVLNYINPKANSAAVKAMRKESAGRKVVMIEHHLSECDFTSLIASCDCYVSLHRSEGLGIPMAKAMYLKKPVIATAYSGNMDFMNANNSFLVDYELVELEQDYGPYEQGNVWAEPNFDHACHQMRFVYENSHVREEIGIRASRDIKSCMNPHKTMEQIKARLQKFHFEG